MTVKTISSYTDEWKDLPWKQFQKNLYRLQHRIYKAAQKNDVERIKRLQTLLVGSNCAKYLAVRQVTQLNIGKRSAGVDGLSKLDPKQRMQLAADLSKLNNWKHQKLRKKYIPKANGTTFALPTSPAFAPEKAGEAGEARERLLGISTIRDRAMQCLIKYALEPVFEASVSPFFSLDSFGPPSPLSLSEGAKARVASFASFGDGAKARVSFRGKRDGDLGLRPGNSTWDVQKCIFNNLNSAANGYRKTIVEIDINKCFDNINHKKLMSLVILPGGLKNVVISALKAGVLTERENPVSGTPPFASFGAKAKEGGVISPLLANIALHGIEDLQNEKVSSTKSIQRGFRYANDMVFILKEGENPDELLNKISEFLKERGLNINETKSKTVLATEGFNFLDWHFLVKPSNNKFLCVPSEENHKAMKKKLKKMVKDTRYPLKDRLKMVKTIYRGWFNYHQYCDMSQLDLWSLHNWVYKYLRKSTKMPLNEITEIVRGIFTEHTQRATRFIAGQ
jgi:retron-type reverse transcriptase